MKEMEIHPITIRELVHPGEILETETQPSSLPVKLVEVRNNNGEVILYKLNVSKKLLEATKKAKETLLKM